MSVNLGLTFQPLSFWGQSGWYLVPTTWFARTNSNGTITASPNSDFSSSVYDAVINESGYMVFQDLMASRQSGIDN